VEPGGGFFRWGAVVQYLNAPGEGWEIFLLEGTAVIVRGGSVKLKEKTPGLSPWGKATLCGGGFVTNRSSRPARYNIKTTQESRKKTSRVGPTQAKWEWRWGRTA